MTKKEFTDTLIAERWMWADSTERKIKGIAFKREFNNNWIKYHISEEGMKVIHKDALLKQLRSHDVLHMTRIVGYYSRVNNWNPSKLGELADRQAGNYAVNADATQRMQRGVTIK